MREYYGGTASVAELYFSNENNESATRYEEEFVITHSNTICLLSHHSLHQSLKKLYEIV
jgi:hypothetical protein